MGNSVKRQIAKATTVVAVLGAFLPLCATSRSAPISDQEFAALAQRCAPTVDSSVLRGVAQTESHFDPLAVRDNTTHQVWAPPSFAVATGLAEDRLRKGHSLDLGLMQINSRNLPTLGLGVTDAFDPCRSLDAAHRILLTAFAAGSSEAERQAAILITLSRYNTGRPLAGIANGYANRVIGALRASPTSKLTQQDAPVSPPQWDIWGASGAGSASWVDAAEESSEIKRAGAQTTEARAEARTAAPPLEKGEPYELSAYQESEPNRP